jgi:hypothetical protein
MINRNVFVVAPGARHAAHPAAAVAARAAVCTRRTAAASDPSVGRGFT